MRRYAVLSLCCLLVTAAAPASATPVTVSFVHPEKFTDATMYGGYGLKAEQPAMDGISQFLTKLGAQYLGPQQSLSIEVLNIDLAGQYEPWRAFAYTVRYLRDIYPPRIKLRYRLTEGDRTLAAGEELVTDSNYLADMRAQHSQDLLAYEKAMLANWFRARLVDLKPAPAHS